MGKLLDYINKQLKIIRDVSEIEKTNVMEARRIPNTFKIFNASERLDKISTYLYANAAKYFGSLDNYRNIIKSVAKDEKFKASVEENGPKYFESKENYEEILKSSNAEDKIFNQFVYDVYDKEKGEYETRINPSTKSKVGMIANEPTVMMFEALEKNLSDEQIDEICQEIDKMPDRMDIPDSHPLEPYAEKLKDESLLNLLNENEKEEYLKSLDYAVQEVVVRDPENQGVEGQYEYHNRGLQIETLRHVEEYANKLGLDGKEFVQNNVKPSDSTLSFSNSDYNKKAMKPLMGKKIELNNDFKQKMTGLYNIINQEGVLQNSQGGESASKEYGFSNFFNVSNDLKNLMTKDISKLDDEAKKAHMLQITEAKKKYEEVSKKYDKVFDYIKQNFDLEKISLPDNVYSGREPSTSTDITKRRQSIPRKWDYENMAPAVILNGFSQVLTTCKLYNVSFEDFINDPSGFYLKQAEKMAVEANKTLLSPKTEPLGKRIAKASLLSDQLYKMNNSLPYIAGRAVELITQIYDGDNKVDNVIAAAANLYEGNQKITEQEKFLGRFENGKYKNQLKYAFIFGDEKDDLYECFPGYTRPDGTNPDLDYRKALQDSNLTLEEAFQKVKDTVNDYGKEELEMWKDSGGDLQRFVSSGTLLHAGHQFLMDYIQEKKIDLSQDNELNKNIKEFLLNPKKAMFDKYLVPELKNESMSDNELCNTYNKVNKELGNEWKNCLNQNKGNAEHIFEQANATQDGPNKNMTLNNTVKANKENFFEWVFRRTSKQYKAVEQAVKDFYDEKSPKYGDLKNLKTACKAYLDYKGVQNKDDIQNVSGKGKNRADFCFKMIESIDETIENHPNVTTIAEKEYTEQAQREPIDNNGSFENAVNENEMDDLNTTIVFEANNKKNMENDTSIDLDDSSMSMDD